ncbi:MAG TPA: methyltransferase domain-containing protein [Actinomycetota bacterium]|jgi:ubiquinone/menaquinone biosynthesis C-methylase UbiE
MRDWRSYDDVAETYERVHAPRFAELARDLVELAGVTRGQRVLDVGTGTGVGAEAAILAGAAVVGLDASTGMLEVGRRQRATIPFVAGRAIDLPFTNARFDVVTGNLVIGHFTKYQTALFDMIRVLKPGGRLALSAWADRRDNLQDAWIELAESVVPRDVLRSALDKAYPWGDHFADRERLEQALVDADLRHVRTEKRRYQFRYGRDEYVEGLSTFTVGRFLREMLGEEGFASFMDRAKAAFSERFADPLNDFRDATLAIATKP